MLSLLVELESQSVLQEAHDRLIAAGFSDIETYTPMPLPSGRSRSSLPLWMFIAGVLGFAGFFVLMTFADVHAYPLNIGGRPKFAWPTFVPIAFELGVLCAMVTGFVGFFIVCRMPRLYDPIDECLAIPRATRDGWLLNISAQDERTLSAARVLLEPLAPVSIEEYSA